LNLKDANNLCMSLLKADSEDEVVTILTAAGYWQDPKSWRFFDDNENNYSSIGNQASHSDAALVEKIVNSVDARLIGECLSRGIDPAGENAPRTIREAVSLFFEENPDTSTAGLISEWSDAKRRQIAKGIAVCATGATPKKGNPCITIADEGEGQTPSMIPGTFMSLTRSNKLRIHFVQGKFNMGGTGVLKFCGVRNLQLILTRKNQSLVRAKKHPDDDKWGFTIVRREEPSEGRKNSIYSYLAPVGANDSPRHGEVLRFAADGMPIFPDTNGQPYVRTSPHGSLVKLYEYSMTGFRTNIIRRDGLLSRLEVLLPSPALPVRLYECRGEYKGHEGSFDTTLAGILNRLADNKAENLEEGFPTGVSVSVGGEIATGMIFAFKKGKTESYKKNEGVLFAINGQTHASLTADFFKRKSVGLSYISDSILVVVDCSRLSGMAVENLFMNSRDRLRAGELRGKLEDLLEEQLKGHDLLRALQEKRRRERIQDRIEDSAPMADILRHIMEKNPTLAKLFTEGQRLSNPLKTNGTGEDNTHFEGKKFPTFFKPKGREYGSIVEKECHKNLRARIMFETDACNDYFTRAIDPGESNVFSVSGGNEESTVITSTLNALNGIATLSVTLPDGTSEGDELDITCEVADVSQIEPFRNSIRINVLGEVEVHGSRGSRHKPPVDQPGDTREKLSGLSLPNIVPVYENQWPQQDPPFDQYSALSAKQAGLSDEGDSGAFDFYVNMDNAYLKHEAKHDPEQAGLIAARFKYGMALVALGIIHASFDKEQQERAGEGEGAEENVEATVYETTRALGPFILPMIDSLGGLSAEEISSLDYVGESE